MMNDEVITKVGFLNILRSRIMCNKAKCTVILAHGLAASLHDWDDLLPVLSASGYADMRLTCSSWRKLQAGRPFQVHRQNGIRSFFRLDRFSAS